MGARTGDRDRRDADLSATGRQHPGGPYFSRVGDALGRNYLRYSFTRGTDQEVSFLREILDLPAGARLLDVGCGPGRHSIPLAESGLAVVGVDISRRFLEIGAEHARAAGVTPAFYEVDARQMPFEDEFDAVISLCQGAFGLMGEHDSLVLARCAQALKSGGRLVLTAFSAYYEMNARRAGVSIDVGGGVVHEVARIEAEDGSQPEVDLWTGIYTPRELRLLALGVGLEPEAVWSVDPGDYARRPPDLDHAEVMLVARKP